MRTISRRLAAFSAVALAATGVAVTATAASADLVTYCNGTAADVTVPNNFVVPEGAICVLDNVTIQGQSEVQADADLIATDSTFEGGVVVDADGFFDAVGSSVAEDVSSQGAFGVYLEDASVGGDYLGEEGDLEETFLYAFETSIAGGVQVALGDLYLQSSQVGDSVSAEGATYTDLIDSTVAGALTVTENEFGAAVCASEVLGAATYTGNGELQIGSGGSLATCDEVNYFGDDVVIDDTVGGVDVTGNIIAGDLTGEGNDPEPTGSDNRVRGDLGGQFTDLEPAEAGFSIQSEREADRSDLVIEDLQERRDAALEDAEEIGSANL